MKDSPLYRIGRNDIERASKVLSRAFDNQPLATYFMPDDTQRQRKSFALYAFSLKYGILYGEVFSPTKKIEGVAIWHHSSHEKHSTFRALRSGILRILRVFDGEMFKRIRLFIYTLHEIQSRLLPEPHWYLSFLAVDPEHQGKGYGGALLKEMLVNIDSQGHPCYLEALGEENIGLYERYGFHVVEEIAFAGHKMWAMVRDNRQ